MLAQLTGDIAACEQQLHATEQELQQARDERLRLEETLGTAQAALKEAVARAGGFIGGAENANGRHCARSAAPGAARG